MQLVSRAQNLLGQMVPQWFKGLTPLMKTVVCVGGSALIALAAVWVYRLRAAASLFGRLTQDRDQCKRMHLCLEAPGGQIRVDMQRKQVVLAGGADFKTPEAMGWLQNFANAMAIHLNNFKQELLLAKDPRTKEEGMELVDHLGIFLRAISLKLSKNEDAKELLSSIKTALTEIEAILTQVGEQVPGVERTSNYEVHGKGTAVALLINDEDIVYNDGDNIPQRCFADLKSFEITVNSTAIKEESVNGIYRIIQGHLKIKNAATHLCKLLVKSHFVASHDQMAAEYFGNKGFNFEPVRAYIAKIQSKDDEFSTLLHLIRVYRATSKIEKPEIAIPNPPALIASKMINFSKSDLLNGAYKDISISETTHAFVNVQVALKKVETM